MGPAHSPRVSVIMPVYNAERFLAQAVESILSQTYADLELVAVDDGSRDKSWALLQAYAQKDARVRVFRNAENAKLSKTLNRALAEAQGEYLVRMDSDDISLPGRVATQVAYMDAHPEVGVSGGSMQIINEQGVPIGVRHYHQTDAEIRKHLFRYSPFSHPTIVLRRRAVDLAGGYEHAFNPAEDYELYFRLGRVAKFGNVPETLIQYRVVAKSMTTGSTRSMEQKTLAIRRKAVCEYGYRMTVLDHMYGWIQWLTMYLMPGGFRVWLFNTVRGWKKTAGEGKFCVEGVRMLEDFKKTLGRVGYAWLWLVALGGLAQAQLFIFSGKSIVVAIFELITVVLLSVWLLQREEKSVGVFKALAFGSVLVVYHWLLYRSSLRWDPNYGISMLAIMSGQVLVFSLHSPFWARPVPERKIVSDDPGARRTQMAVYFGITLLSMVLVIVLGKRYLSMYDYTGVMNWFFVYRWDGIIGDIPSATFKAWGRLWMPLMYIAVLVGSFSYILKAQEKLGVWKSLLWIYVLGNIGGVVLVTLADAGIWSLVMQVKSVHYHFYGVAKSFKSLSELWAMVGTYASKEMYQYVSFPGTHPPFAIILNWFLIQITGDNIMLIGILLGALAWTGVFPMYLLGRELYNREMGYYMAGLYLVMPSTLILNHVTLDALTATLVAWGFAFVVMGSRRKKSGWMFLAGLIVAAVAATNYSTPLIIPAMFLLALMGLRDQGKWSEGFLAWTKAAAIKCGLFFLGIGLPYALILWSTQGKFDYLAMMEHTISATRQGVAQHPWFVGGWMCWFEYFIHIGAVVTALYLVRWREIFRGDWRNDVLPWAGLVTLMVPFVLGAGRQETEREFMLFNVLIVGTAALALWKGKGFFRYMQRASDTPVVVEEMGQGWRGMFYAVLAGSYLNAMVIEMLMVDHW